MTCHVRVGPLVHLLRMLTNQGARCRVAGGVLPAGATLPTGTSPAPPPPPPPPPCPSWQLLPTQLTPICTCLLPPLQTAATPKALGESAPPSSVPSARRASAATPLCLMGWTRRGWRSSGGHGARKLCYSGGSALFWGMGPRLTCAAGGPGIHQWPWCLRGPGPARALAVDAAADH